MPTKMAPVKSYAILNDSKMAMPTTDSSVGRAEDCRVNTEILRSLVRVRVGGVPFSLSHFVYLRNNSVKLNPLASWLLLSV